MSIANKSNVWKVKVFHIYRHGKKSKSMVSFITRSSVKRLIPLKRIEIKRKARVCTLIVRTKQWSMRLDGSQRKFFSNDAAILKKNTNFINNETKGPTILELSRRKQLGFFKDLQ